MRNKVRSILLLPVVLCLLSTAAFAAGWGVKTTITGYYVYDVGAAYIRLENMENPDSCLSNRYLILEPNAQNFRAIWAQVIAAQTTGTTVTVRYNGCIGNYPKIDAVAVPERW